MQTACQSFLLLILWLPGSYAQVSVDSLWTVDQNTYNLDRAIDDIELSKSLRTSNILLASSTIERAIEYLENIERDSLLAIALVQKAVVLSYQAEYDEAFTVNFRALQLANSSQDTIAMIDALNNIGVDYYYLEDFGRSLEYFEQVRELSELAGNAERAANAYNNVGLVQAELGNYENEEMSYLRARDIMRSINDVEGIALTNLNLGTLYLMNGQLKEAGDALQNSADGFESINNLSGLFDAKSSMVALYEARGSLDAAISLARSSLENAEKAGFRSNVIDFLQLLEQLYIKTGLMDSAYSFLKRRKELEEEMLNEEKSRTIAELETAFETAQKEQEIEELSLENKKVNAELQAEANQRRFLIALSVILLLLALFVGWRYRYKQRLNQLLEEKNKVISKSLKERETLLKEIHHRVKNNLQVISSLLNLQSRFIKDEAALDAVKEGRNRVKSMAMIHQKLYQESNLSGIKMREYIVNLTESLEKSYGIDDEKVSIEIDVDDIILDIDTLIPLGLILNELVSNTYKYAFPDDQTGNLTIELKERGEILELVVADNGVGMKSTSNQDLRSFGTTLIRSLAEKLKAEVEVNNGSGTEYRIKIRHYQKTI